MTLDECERHFELVRAAASIGEVCHRLAPLLDAYSLMSVEIGRATTFWRARAAGRSPWTDTAEMCYPPGEHASLGRLNDKGSPIFYAASREETALAEIGIKSGSHVQVAGFRVRPDAPPRLLVIGELFHVYRVGYLRTFGIDPDNTFAKTLNSMNVSHARCVLYIDAFLAALLADPKASDSGYLHSRAVAMTVMSRQNVDGFFFPSVKDPLGMNFALKPDAFDKSMEMVLCTHGVVHKVREFGLLDHEVISDAVLTHEGALAWMQPVPGRRAFFNPTPEEDAAARAEA